MYLKYCAIIISPFRQGLTSIQSEMVIMEAFQVHRIKEVSRQQLTSALRGGNILPSAMKALDKGRLIKAVAALLLSRGVVEVQGALDGTLRRSDIKKVGVF